MFCSLILAAALAGQAPRPTPGDAAAGITTTNARGLTPEQRREAARARNLARTRQAQVAREQARSDAYEWMLHEERMAPVYAAQQAAQVQAYSQLQSAEAWQNIGIAARVDAETRRLRYLSQYGPGQLMILNAPRVITPAEVIQSQLGPR
jgi:phage terminase Nu1 subunit (DNA packaging protein)